MADLASSAVTTVRYYQGLGASSKNYTFKDLSLELTGQGTTTNAITAAVLGLTTIQGSTPAVKDDNTEVLPTAPSADNLKLLIGGGASNAPADYTGTYTVTVWGYTY